MGAKDKTEKDKLFKALRYFIYFIIVIFIFKLIVIYFNWIAG